MSLTRSHVLHLAGWHIPRSADHTGHGAAVRAGEEVKDEIHRAERLP